MCVTICGRFRSDECAVAGYGLSLIHIYVIYDCEPWMASETFSYMCSLFPGVETFVGIKNDELGSGANHHTPEFDLDEDGLDVYKRQPSGSITI